MHRVENGIIFKNLLNFPSPLEIAHQFQGTMVKDCLALSVWGTRRVSDSLIPSQVEPPVISPGVERLDDHYHQDSSMTA